MQRTSQNKHVLKKVRFPPPPSLRVLSREKKKGIALEFVGTTLQGRRRNSRGHRAPPAQKKKGSMDSLLVEFECACARASCVRACWRRRRRRRQRDDRQTLGAVHTIEEAKKMVRVCVCVCVCVCANPAACSLHVLSPATLSP